MSRSTTTTNSRPPQDATFDLEHFLPYQLNVLAARLSRGLASNYRERWGISIPEWRVIAHLSQDESVSVREIHAKVDMDKSKVSRAATRLERRGLVSKQRSAHDGRLVELALSTKGRSLMNELAPLAESYETLVMERLSPRKARAFRRAIETLLEVVE